MTLEQFLRNKRQAGDDLSDAAAVAQAALFAAGWKTITTTLGGLNDLIADAVGDVVMAEAVVNRLLAAITARGNNSPAVEATLSSLRAGAKENITGTSTRGVILDEIAKGNINSDDQAVLMSVLRNEEVYTAQDVTDTLSALDREDAIRTASRALDAARQAGGVQADKTPTDKAEIKSKVVESLDAWIAE